MDKNIIITDKAPQAIGPYSQGIITGGLIFTSGQIPVNPSDGTIAKETDTQAKQVLDNLGAVLKSAGAGFEDVVKTTVFIKNMNDFARINEIYGAYFKEPYPARSCVEAARLPKDVLIEIEAIAIKR